MSDTRHENIERLAARLIHHSRRAHFFDSDSERNCTIAADDLEAVLKNKEANYQKELT